VRRPAQSNEKPRFYGVREAAALLGTSEMTLYRAIAAGEFPAVRIRGRVIVPAKAIDEIESAAMATGAVDAADFVAGSGVS
jgi:excisionase family DNA binding protein